MSFKGLFGDAYDPPDPRVLGGRRRGLNQVSDPASQHPLVGRAGEALSSATVSELFEDMLESESVMGLTFSSCSCFRRV